MDVNREDTSVENEPGVHCGESTPHKTIIACIVGSCEFLDIDCSSRSSFCVPLGCSRMLSAVECSKGIPK